MKKVNEISKIIKDNPDLLVSLAMKNLLKMPKNKQGLLSKKTRR